MRILLLILLAFTITGCGTREQKRNADENVPVLDSTYIFNGRNLEGWIVTNYGPQGPVEVSGGNLILGMGDGCTGVTIDRPIPEINYEVNLEAKRVSGTDFFCGLTFPVGGSYCTLIVGGWGGTTVGLSCINGMDASENETTRLMKFEEGRWYRIRLRVTDEEINAWIDDEKAVSIMTEGKEFSVRPEVNLNIPFGIASWKTTAALRNIRVTGI